MDAVFNKGTIIKLNHAVDEFHVTRTVVGREPLRVEKVVHHTVECVLEETAAIKVASFPYGTLRNVNSERGARTHYTAE